MNGLAKQRGSRFFVAERHHNHSDVTVGTFYEEKKTYNLVTVSIRSKQNTTMQSIPWFLRFYFFYFSFFFFSFWWTILLVMEVSSAASSHMTAQSNKQWIYSNTDVTHLMEHVLFATIIQRTNCMDVLLSFLVNMLHHMFGVNLETVLMNC